VVGALHAGSAVAVTIGKRIPSLDGMRALSIALVLAAHLSGTRHFFSTATLQPLGDLGNLGVRTFFVISGFLITRLLLLELEKTRRISLKAFYARRFLRIFPAFYAFIAVVSILAPLGFVQLDRSDVVHAVTYTMNYHSTENFIVFHLWSLSVEEQFYLLWPVTLVLLGLRRSVWALAVVLFIVPVIRLAIYVRFPGQEELIRMSFQTVCDALATGCLLAIALPTVLRSERLRQALRSPFIAALPAAVLIANVQTNHPKAFFVLCIPFMNVAIAVLIARYVQWPDLPAARILNTRPLVAIGIASYSLYLWQQLFLIQFRPPQSPLQVFPLNLMMAVLCAAVSYACIEKPFLRLKGRFEPVARSRPASVALGRDDASAVTDRGLQPAG
jgi:peptidoglycan/LPS O-acetylase OafA/YrhL